MKKKLFLIWSCFSIGFLQGAISEKIEPSSFYSPGETINSSMNTYSIVEKIGEGFFAEVFAVEDPNKQRFALKAYKLQDETFSSILLADAKREFQRGQILDHPNIIKSFDLFRASSSFNQVANNLILQFVDGRTLFHTRKGALSREEALKSALQLGHALHYALSCNFLHLDLHAGNVMLTNEADIMVIDLASFFTFDELFQFVKQNPSPKALEKSEPLMAQANFLLPISVPSQDSLDSTKAEKIKQFFIRNPELLSKLQQREQERRAMIPFFFHLHSSNPEEPDRTPLHSYYFDLITEACISILGKAHLNREEKIALRIEIKKLAWNYAEDVEEGKVISFDYYLEKLLALFK